MRKHLYTALVNTLKGIPEIKHIDLWNQNVDFIEQESPWPRPAVFIEFAPTTWSPLAGPFLRWRGSGQINLHIVTDWSGQAEPGTEEMESNLIGWALAEKIQKAMEGLRGKGFDSVTISSTVTNHNHEDIVDNVEVYSFRAERQIYSGDAD